MAALAKEEPRPRAILAAAIARTVALTRDIEANRAAQAETSAAISDANERLAEARQAAEEQCHSRSLADVQTAIKAAKAARESLETAEELLSALRLHRDRLEVDADRLRVDLEWARGSVQRAITEVAWPAVEAKLVARYNSAQLELLALGATIRSVTAVLPPSLNWNAVPCVPVAIDERWSQWIEALKADAAALPPLELR